MDIKTTVNKSINYLEISPEDIKKLASFCIKNWKSDYDIAHEKWMNIKKPQLEKDIEKHNKDVKNKKAVYSFNTYQNISESDKLVIFERERKYFIHTTEHVYEFRANFEIHTSKKVYSDISEEFLDTIAYDDIQKVMFKSISKDENQITVEMNFKGDWFIKPKLSYELKGNDKWVTHTTAELLEIIDTLKRPADITRYKIPLALTASIVAIISIISLIRKLNLREFIENNTSLNAGFILYILTVSIIYFVGKTVFNYTNKVLPDFYLTTNKKPESKGFVTALVLAFVISILWEGFTLLFK